MPRRKRSWTQQPWYFLSIDTLIFYMLTFFLVLVTFFCSCCKANIDFVGGGASHDWHDSVGLRGGHLSGNTHAHENIHRYISFVRSSSSSLNVV